MGYNKESIVLTKEFLINRLGQLHIRKSFLFIFTTRFFQFIKRNR